MAENEVENKEKIEANKAEEVKKQDDKKSANQNKKADETNEKEEESVQVKQKRDKIKQAAKDFWGPTGAGFGATHEVSEWSTDENGQILLSHFSSESKDAVLYNDCLEYRECLSKYQKAKGDANYDYDESCVAFDRLQTDYDVAFYVVLSGLPRILISSTNQHTMGFVMTRFKEGKLIGSIVKEAREKLNQQPAADGKDGKGKKKEGSENEENKENQEPKADEQTQEPKNQEQAMQEKKEQDAWAVVVMKDNVFKDIKDGAFGNEAKEAYKKVVDELFHQGYKDMKVINQEFAKRFNDMVKNGEITINNIKGIRNMYSNEEIVNQKKNSKINNNYSDNEINYSGNVQNTELGDQ